MSTKILFTFEAEDLGVAKKQDEISDRLKRIRKEIQDAKREGSPYTELIKESQILKREQDELRKKQRELNREFQATKVPKDSLAGLRLEYSKLVDQINKLSEAQRKSDFGKSLISQAATAKAKINEFEAEVGRFTGNVGNYKSALAGIGDAITGGLVTGGIGAAVIALTGVMKLGTDQALKYEKALDDLSALTGLQGAALDNLDRLARQLQTIDLNGVEIVKTGPEILDALKLVGGARPELLKDADALADVTKQAIILSQASGDDLQTSVKGLTTILGQFDLAGSESRRVINELAAGAKEGAAEIPQITDALRETGTVAKIFNVSTTESIALVELLADKQLKGAEAGTQLRNIFSKLASADILPKPAQAQFQKLGIDINVLKDTTLPLEKRLKELGKAQGDLSALTKIFGLENLQAATIITSGLPKYEALLKAVEGTNEAYIQAEIRADNTATKLDNLANKSLNRLEEKFHDTTGSINLIVSALDFLVDKVDIVGAAFSGLEAAVVGPFAIIRNRILDFFGDKDQKTIGANVDQVKASLEAVGANLSDLGITDTTPAQDKLTELLLQVDKLKSASNELDKEDKKLKDKSKKEAPAAEGSLQFFRDEVRKLQEQLEKTPVKSPLVDGLIKKLKDAETQLRVVEQQLKDLRNPPGAPQSEFDQANAGLVELGVGISPDTEAEAAAKLRALAKSLAEQAGVINLEVEADDASIQRTLNKLNELEAKNKEKQEKEAEQKKEQEQNVQDAIEDGAIQSAQNIADAVTQIKANQLEQEQAAKFEQLSAEEQKAIDAAQGNAAKEKLIREDFERRRAALEKEGARKRKELAKKEALINTALAVTKALTGAPPPFSFILAGVAAIAGAAQLAVIESQEFWQGGKVKRLGSGKVRERQNAPRTAHGDTVLAYLKPGEMVLNEQQQSRIQGMAGRNIFAKAGVPGYANATPVPHFASGGVVSDIVPQTTAYSYAGSNGQQVNATFSNDQVLIIARTIAGEVSTQVGSEVRTGIGVGLNDANRRLERESQLETNRQG